MDFIPSLPTGLVLISPVIGSFLGVLAWRLPEGRSPFFTRSRCPVCEGVLGARELIPLLSYAVQRGKCRRCQAPIDPFHPAMEAAALGIAGACDVAAHMGIAAPGLPRLMIEGCLFGWWLLLLAAIDLRSFTLPDYLTIPLMGTGLAFASLNGKTNFHIHCLAALIAWLALEGVATLYRRFRGRDGLGGGDAKLLAAGGGWLGPLILPEILFSGALLTLIGAWILQRGRLDGNTRVPFGPGLALALWGGWLFQATGSLHG
ncbi:prepilin peptidase [Asaia krungthepensis]|uniref:Prepilin leader peptidase/N-methyltransferase n=1 Tax=Asaia krungthepensis NRIC 0535 TaxID=1307925 RepID=A0ABQ0Q225_9PROT|nr:A24 family peptidase [Asaia krungthepensis]GBQ87691.1 prepilin peptidase [Asaia krungthepensis NRIC 0535]